MKNNKVRLTIITDSLGMVRDCTPREKTWIELLLNDLTSSLTGGGAITYFFPKRGRHTHDIVCDNYDLLLYQKSDIVIIQVGVVDCSRRVIPARFANLINKFPIIRTLFAKFTSRFMYELTRLYEYRYVSPTNFRKNIKNICDDIYSANPNAKIFWLQIAPAGEYLIKKIFNIQKDIDTYNQILSECAKEKGFTIINPYREHKADDIVIYDGHHLSDSGHKLVYEATKAIFA